MKENLKKTISVLLVLLFATLSVCCGSGKDNSSSEATSVESSDSQSPLLSKEEALLLVENDKTLTEIFTCNLLCGQNVKTAERISVPETEEFSRFEDIIKLAESTYAPHSGDIEYFLEYSVFGEKTVLNDNGNVSVFFDPRPAYSSFIDPATLQISDTDDENIKEINALDLNGSPVSLRAVYNGEAWLLEKGIYRSHPVSSVENKELWGKCRSGSFSELKGRVLVVEFFISDEESEITPEAEEAFHSIIAPVFEKLTQDANGFWNTADYGSLVEFEYKRAYFEHDEVLGDTVLDFDVMLAETGFGSLYFFAENEYDLSEYDNFVFVVCINKSVPFTYALYDKDDNMEIYYGERVIINPETTSAELYKGVLHLLGGYGYDEGVLDEYTESLYRLLFENDCFTAENTFLSEMSPINAYLCGVTDELKEEFYLFIPNKH